MPLTDAQGGLGAIGAIAGATPWGALITTGLGIAQGISGKIKARNAQRDLENAQSPVYAPNQGILDYYNKALQKYDTNPYDSELYKRSVQDAKRGTITGLDALRGRGGAVAGVSNLIANQDNSLLKAGISAEGVRSQGLNTLGHAAQLKAGEDAKAFKINQMDPFERKYNLLAMKASGANKVEGAGISNVLGGVNAIDDLMKAKLAYGLNDDTKNKLKKKFGSLTTGASSSDNSYDNFNFGNIG